MKKINELMYTRKRWFFGFRQKINIYYSRDDITVTRPTDRVALHLSFSRLECEWGEYGNRDCQASQSLALHHDRCYGSCLSLHWLEDDVSYLVRYCADDLRKNLTLSSGSRIFSYYLDMIVLYGIPLQFIVYARSEL